jgi:hypothetical protein
MPEWHVVMVRLMTQYTRNQAQAFRCADWAEGLHRCPLKHTRRLAARLIGWVAANSESWALWGAGPDRQGEHSPSRNSPGQVAGMARRHRPCNAQGATRGFGDPSDAPRPPLCDAMT